MGFLEMNYKIVIERKAEKFILRQPKEQQLRILSAINNLPSTGDIKKLKGHLDVYRLRVGTYRIIYSIDNGNLIVCVIDVGNRGDVYK